MGDGWGSLQIQEGLGKKEGVVFTQSYRNQSIDLQSTLIDWFLYDRELHHERGKDVIRKLP